MSKRIYKCNKCDKIITKWSKSGFCRRCSQKGRKNPNAKSNQKYYCKKCGNEISIKCKTGLCKSCSRIGKTLPEETKAKISKTLTGRKCSPVTEETKLKISKANTGKKRSKKTCEKISKALKGKKKKLRTKEHRKNLSKSLTGRKASKEERKNLSLAHGGTGIPHENYDLSWTIRQSSEYFEWRDKVYQRDNYTCQECGQVGGKLEAHHLKQFAIIFKEFLLKYSQYSPIEDKQTLLEFALNHKPFWNINNGQTLCKDCHKLTR